MGYGDHQVLQPFDLTVNQGEKIALIGQSGSGKSTLLRHLRSLSPDIIAWCPQDPGLVPMLSTFHNTYAGSLGQYSLFYNLLNLVFPQKKAIADVRDILMLLGLSEYLSKPVSQLSGGQMQRVGLARAMASGQSLFLGDEPVSAVDEYQAKELMRLISEKHDTCIVALHDIELALAFATRIIGLKDGQIMIDQSAETISSEQITALYSADNED
nr:ATP-binding cassette domain-containing protein [Endozoicomonas sp. OPT23]